MAYIPIKNHQKSVKIITMWLWVKTLVPGWYIAGKWIVIAPNIVMIGHGSLNVPIEHHPTIRYMVYNGYYKVMSNIPKMGQLPTPVGFDPSPCPKKDPTVVVLACSCAGKPPEGPLRLRISCVTRCRASRRFFCAGSCAAAERGIPGRPFVGKTTRTSGRPLENNHQ